MASATTTALGAENATGVPAAGTNAALQGAGGGTTAPEAQPASDRLRAGYRRWRTRLRRHDVFVGRNLLREASDAGTEAAPAARELRGSIRRMQRRWNRWLQTTTEGRTVRFRMNVRRKVPQWGVSHLRGIAWCESRNNPRAIGGEGAYRGLYQFSFSTWQVVGGSGDPAAASRPEQTWRAWLLLSRHGAGHWPVCG